MDGNHPFPYAENGFADPFGRETEARSSSVRKSSLDKNKITSLKINCSYMKLV